MKNLFLLAHILLVVISCSQSKPTPNVNSAASSSSAAPITITADKLTREYKKNELAADEMFLGKPVIVTGKILSISQIAGAVSVDLEGVKEAGINFTSVSCAFDDSVKPKLTALKAGQFATFHCTGDGMTANLFVNLKDCDLTNPR